MTARRVANGIAAYAVSFASNTGMQLLMVPVLVHFWGLSQYGLWIILTALPTYLMLGNLGLSVVAANDIAASLARDDVGRAKVIYSTVTASVAAISAFLLVIGLSVALFVPARVIPGSDHVDPDAMRLAVIALIIYGVVAIKSELAMVPFRATGQFARGVTLLMAITFLERCGVIAVAAFGFHASAIAMVTIRLLGVAYMFLQSRRANPDLVPRLSEVTLDEARRIAKLGFGVILFTLGTAINLQGPILAVGMLVPPSVVALFSATRTVTRFGIQAANAISVPVMVEFAIATGSEDKMRQRRLFSFNVVVSAAILFATFIVFVVVGPQLTYFWLVKAARPSITLMTLLAAGTFLQGVWIVGANSLIASNRQFSFTPVFCVTGIVAVAVGAIATWIWGVDGMAAVLAAADLVMCFWIYKTVAKFGIGTLAEAPAIAIDSLKGLHNRRRAARQAKG